jgi:hypothetical protein
MTYLCSTLISDKTLFVTESIHFICCKTNKNCKIFSDQLKKCIEMTQNFKRPENFKEEFTSGGGSYINLGHYKTKNVLGDSSVEYKPSFMAHSASSELIKEPCAVQGLNQTRFHKGFQRRSQDNIINTFSAEEHQKREQFAASKAHHSAIMTQSRSQLLRDVDTRTGYNLITGATTGKGPTHKTEGIRSCGDGLGPEAQRRGKNTLKDSGGRFFLPQASGVTADYRQDVLYKEGLKNAKYSSVIQIGKKDIPSSGVEDQFSKSQYQRNNIVTSTGLVESRFPGRFTPRQVPSNPSGHKTIVEKWTTGVDINNNTKHCKQ